MIWLWPALGAAAVAAALLYTLGKRPYGYRGYGDIAVLVFFGWLAVLGSRALQTGTLHASAWWPATAVGLWSVMVLNLNNMRDRESDAAAQRRGSQHTNCDGRPFQASSRWSRTP